MDLSTLLLCVFIALVSILFYYTHERFNYFKNAGIAFEPPGLAFGNMQGVRFTRTFSEIWEQFYFKFKGTGPFAGFFFFQKPSAFILDIELMKNILIKDFAKFKDDPLSGQQFLLDGQNLPSGSPTFTLDEMKFIFPTFIKVGEDFAKVFASMVQQSSQVEVKEVLARYTTDVIGTCAFGYALYELAQHEDIQQRAREEVQQVLAKHNQEFTYECMEEMKYLDQIISETLRLYTIVPVLNRQALVDYVVPGNPKYVITKGMPVIIPAEAIHHDPDYYTNPMVFDPERFSAEMVQDRDSILWLPFGDGPRNYVGMHIGQMKTRIGLVLLLKSFKFTTCKDTQIPLQFDVKNFLKTSKDGIYLKAETL